MSDQPKKLPWRYGEPRELREGDTVRLGDGNEFEIVPSGDSDYPWRRWGEPDGTLWDWTDAGNYWRCGRTHDCDIVEIITKPEPEPAIIDHEDGDQTRVVTIPVRMRKAMWEDWDVAGFRAAEYHDYYMRPSGYLARRGWSSPADGPSLILQPRAPQLTETEAWIVERMKEGKLDLARKAKWLSYGGYGWIVSVRDDEIKAYETGRRRSILDPEIYDLPPTPAEPTLIDLTRLREIAGAPELQPSQEA